MRIRGQTAAIGEVLPEIMQLLFIEAPFQVSARVIARRGVALKIDEVRRPAAVAAAEKMIVSHFIKCRAGSVIPDVAADAVMLASGFHDHRHRVPPDVALAPRSHPPPAGL